MANPATRVLAPFTDDQVRELNQYQRLSLMHPFTCPNRHADRNLIAHADGWTCPSCDYTQKWAHIWTSDGSWRDAGWFVP